MKKKPLGLRLTKVSDEQLADMWIDLNSWKVSAGLPAYLRRKYKNGWTEDQPYQLMRQIEGEIVNRAIDKRAKTFKETNP